MHVVAGVDLSLTGLALAAAPVDWACDFTRVRSVTLSTSPSDGSVVQRMRDLACDAAAWLEWARVTHVYLEQPIITRKQHNLDQAFRLGGMLEMRVLELMGVECKWAPLIKARIMFCGNISKEVAQAALESVPTLKDQHQRDAFVVMNWAMSELEQACMMVRRAA
jgi:hypothetical protein